MLVLCMLYVCMYVVCMYACVCIEGGGGGCTGGKLSVREIPLSVCHSYLLHVLASTKYVDHSTAVDKRRQE